MKEFFFLSDIKNIYIVYFSGKVHCPHPEESKSVNQSPGNTPVVPSHSPVPLQSPRENSHSPQPGNAPGRWPQWPLITLGKMFATTNTVYIISNMQILVLFLLHIKEIPIQFFQVVPMCKPNIFFFLQDIFNLCLFTCLLLSVLYVLCFYPTTNF